jgi:hypothetical protein
MRTAAGVELAGRGDPKGLLQASCEGLIPGAESGASENYDRGLRDGARLVLGALEDLGVLSAPIAAAMRGETDRIVKTHESSGLKQAHAERSLTAATPPAVARGAGGVNLEWEPNVLDMTQR